MKDPYTFSQYNSKERHDKKGNSGSSIPGSSVGGPRKATIRRILDYSKALEVLPSGGRSRNYELIRN